MQIRATTLPRPLIILTQKGTQSFVKEKPLQRAWEALPVETSALADERTTYISQETGSYSYQQHDGKKKWYKKTEGTRDRRVEDWAKISGAYQFAHLWSSGLFCPVKQSHTEREKNNSLLLLLLSNCWIKWDQYLVKSGFVYTSLIVWMLARITAITCE